MTCLAQIDQGVLTNFCSLFNTDEGSLCRNTVCKMMTHTA
jgi:hypothetical protein